MCIIIMVLAVEEITAATLRIQIPKQYTKAIFGQHASQVYRSGGFANTALDIINSNFFQAFNLQKKLRIRKLFFCLAGQGLVMQQYAMISGRACRACTTFPGMSYTAFPLLLAALFFSILRYLYPAYIPMQQDWIKRIGTKLFQYIPNIFKT